ncbi:MAG: hypothetical protein ABTS22_06465, partial [Accumulibacter sp.]
MAFLKPFDVFPVDAPIHLIGEGVSELRRRHPERDYSNLIDLPGLTVIRPAFVTMRCGRQNLSLSSFASAKLNKCADSYSNISRPVLIVQWPSFLLIERTTRWRLRRKTPPVWRSDWGATCR